jgi:hypothetical protein
MSAVPEPETRGPEQCPADLTAHLFLAVGPEIDPFADPQAFANEIKPASVARQIGHRDRNLGSIGALRTSAKPGRHPVIA